jgi:hypothetical protein
MFANQRLGRLAAMVFAAASVAAATAATGATRTEAFARTSQAWRDSGPRALALQHEPSDRGSIRTPLRAPSRRVLVRDLAIDSGHGVKFTCEVSAPIARAADSRPDAETEYSVLGRAPPPAFLS